jgi:predicted methyltransferase
MLQFKATKEQRKKLFSLFSRYNKYRPKPDRNLDQFWATEETVLKRAIMLGNAKNIAKKQLIFLGDDDLLSLAFSTLYQAKRITVIDIDQRLLQFIDRISKKENLPIELFKHDLRYPLKKSLFKNYDIVFCDPPYTTQAINTWLIRMTEATLGAGSNKKRKKAEFLSSKLYLMCYGYTDTGMHRGLKVQQIITSLGLIIQEKLRKFNNYYGAQSIKSESDLYVIQPTPKVNIRQLDIARSQFYTGYKAKK